MLDNSHRRGRTLGEIADAQARAAETMEDDQRRLFENAQRLAQSADTSREIRLPKV